MMSDNTADVILITRDAQLRETLMRERPPSAELSCLSPDDLARSAPPPAEQWWVDLDCLSAPKIGKCGRRVYFYSQLPEKPERLPTGLFLRKPCALPVATVLWAGLAPSTLESGGAARQASAEALPAWLLDLHELDLREFCHKCVSKLPAWLGYSNVTLYLYEAEQNVLTLAETNRKRAIDLAIPLDPANDHVIAAVARAGHRLVAADLAETCRAQGLRCPADLVRERTRAAVITPLISHGKLCGLLQLSKRRRSHASETDLPLDRIFAFLARSLHHARQHLHARIEARVDRLTGLFNYRWMIEALGKEIRRSQRYGSPLALIMLDLDGLKAVNDRRGHLAGNALLRHCAGKVTAALRQADSAARVGGDEFVVLLPATELEGARHVAERIVTTIRTDAPLLDQKPLTVTASVGVAQWQAGWDTQHLMQAADKAMYAAKRDADKRVVCHPHEPAAAVSPHTQPD